MIDELDRFFSIVVAALVTIEYLVFVVIQIRNSLYIERKCRQLADWESEADEYLELEADEYWEFEVDE